MIHWGLLEVSENKIMSSLIGLRFEKRIDELVHCDGGCPNLRVPTDLPSQSVANQAKKVIGLLLRNNVGLTSSLINPLGNEAIVIEIYRENKSWMIECYGDNKIIVLTNDKGQINSKEITMDQLERELEEAGRNISEKMVRCE